MNVADIEEYGYLRAIKGMSLSHFDEADDVVKWWEVQEPKARKRAILLTQKNTRTLEIFAPDLDLGRCKSYSCFLARIRHLHCWLYTLISKHDAQVIKTRADI